MVEELGIRNRCATSRGCNKEVGALDPKCGALI